MKYGVKQFSDITVEESNHIQNNRITSIFRISEDELNTFIKADTLNSYFVEVPPVNLHSKEQIEAALHFVDASDLNGKLQWMYLTAYYNGGGVLFRKSDTEGMCEILYIFSEVPKSQLLNRDNPVHVIDGELGFRAVWLLQLYSPKNLLLTPSITLNIEIDGETYFNRSVSTMVSLMQPQVQVAVINKIVSGFGEMKISIIFNNDDIDNDIHISYH